jgi:cell wall assembly regulator SMI1
MQIPDVLPMEDLILQLEAWLHRNHPRYLTNLRPGLPPNEISQCEHALMMQLPSAYHKLLSWHNGQLHPRPYMQFAWSFLSLQESLAVRKNLININREIEADTPRSHWWFSSWIPFLDDAGDLMCIDTQGEFLGNPGQIIAFFHDDSARLVEFPSLEHWLTCFVRTLELGLWVEQNNRLELSDRAAYDAFCQDFLPGFPRSV